MTWLLLLVGAAVVAGLWWLWRALGKTLHDERDQEGDY